jgi:hypothetical protein
LYVGLASWALAANPLAASGADRALRYFEETGGRSLDDYVTSLRPPAISAEDKARALAMVRPQDIVPPSAERQAKLDALHPVLEYLERSSTTEVKVLRLGLAWAASLQGAAVLVSEEAIDLLTVEELQAVVAHELAHEYFAGEYEAARAGHHYDTVREIELRCDAVSILTMTRLGREPGALLSGVSKLLRFNEQRGYPSSRVLGPTFEERQALGRAMVALVAHSGQPSAASRRLARR